ncbi:MAG: 3-hydroxybutyryl-CoA dehydrogenase; 3-hydroxyacyl-CoA dehydrogenase, partial [uncultured Nocardioidaceae bacterium]
GTVVRHGGRGRSRDDGRRDRRGAGALRAAGRRRRGRPGRRAARAGAPGRLHRPRRRQGQAHRPGGRRGPRPHHDRHRAVGAAGLRPRPGGRPRAHGAQGCAVRRARRAAAAVRRPGDQHLGAVGHRAGHRHVPPQPGRRSALVQPGARHGAGGGRPHRRHRPVGAGGRPGAGLPRRQDERHGRRPRRLHRQRPAVRLPQQRPAHVREPVRLARGHRRGHAPGHRASHGAAGPARPHRTGLRLRDPRDDVRAVPRPPPRSGAAAQAVRHGGPARPQDRARHLHLRRPRLARGRRGRHPAGDLRSARAHRAADRRRRHGDDGQRHRRGVRPGRLRRRLPGARRGPARAGAGADRGLARQGPAAGPADRAGPGRDAGPAARHDGAGRPGRLRSRRRGRGGGPGGQEGAVRGARRGRAAGRGAGHHHLQPAGHRVRAGHLPAAGRRGDALVQPRDRHAAGGGGADGDHGRRRGRHRPGGVPDDGQAPGAVRRPRRLHRQRPAVPLPQRRRTDARGPLRERRRHRHGDEDRLRPADGPVRAARRRRQRRLAGHPAHAVRRVPRAGVRAGATAGAPGDRGLPGTQDQPRVPRLQRAV